MTELRMDKLDFDALMEDAEKNKRYGECSSCEENHMLCWCGVCFKYCHDDYFHEEQYDPMDDDE